MDNPPATVLRRIWVPRIVGVVVAGLALVAGNKGACADAIDGDWCLASKSLNIRGPHIRTPEGTELDGDYTRHTFRYSRAAKDATAVGGTVAMQLLNEETMALTGGDGSTTPEIWKRCKPIS